MSTTNLLSELNEITRQSQAAARQFLQLTDKQLNYKKSGDSWSILECLEHLNLYGDYYLPEITKQMNRSKSEASIEFHSGWLGNYFANSMKEKNGKIMKMKSPKDKIPAVSNLSLQTIHRFLGQVEMLQDLLKLAAQKNLNKIKIPISISKYIRINLGDAFRFYIFHIERHIAQAKRNRLMEDRREG